MITPLQPEKFFTGQWTGKGEFRMHSLMRLLVPDQTIRYKGYTTWLTDELWMATEEFLLPAQVQPTERRSSRSSSRGGFT
jgi:hypothetical protein